MVTEGDFHEFRQNIVKIDGKIVINGTCTSTSDTILQNYSQLAPQIIHRDVL